MRGSRERQVKWKGGKNNILYVPVKIVDTLTHSKITKWFFQEESKIFAWFMSIGREKGFKKSLSKMYLRSSAAGLYSRTCLDAGESLSNAELLGANTVNGPWPVLG